MSGEMVWKCDASGCNNSYKTDRIYVPKEIVQIKANSKAYFKNGIEDADASFSKSFDLCSDCFLSLFSNALKEDNNG